MCSLTNLTLRVASNSRKALIRGAAGDEGALGLALGDHRGFLVVHD